MRSVIEVNENSKVHGLIVQLPLDSIHTINTERIINAVAPEKDVDGYRKYNSVLTIMPLNYNSDLVWLLTKCILLH